MQPSPDEIERFKAEVLAYYAASGRHDLPWRLPRPDGTFDPYRILVSELMLQQTQVGRVIPKYDAFLTRFPSVDQLAAAPLADVLVAWQGLGYNRRAKYLWQAAAVVDAAPDGLFPETPEGLVALPGVGKNTAGAILAYAYDRPVAFIETNIRSVLIHHFSKGTEAVHDRELLMVAETALPPPDSPPGSVRHWYWALMDYGTHLKKSAGNAARRSATYTRQSAFEGSRRQVRGAVLRLLADGPLSIEQLTVQIPDERLEGVLEDLGREQLIGRRGSQLELYGR